MKITMIAALALLFVTNGFATTGQLEKQLSETVTETYVLKNGIYERVALKRIGKEKLTFIINGEELSEVLIEFTGEEELMEEKYLIPLEGEVEFKLHQDGTDEFPDYDEKYSFPAKIKLNGNKIQSLLSSESTLTGHFKPLFEEMIKFELGSGEILPEDVVIEMIKVKASPLKCLPKNEKLYCQYKLKVHAKAFAE